MNGQRKYLLGGAAILNRCEKLCKMLHDDCGQGILNGSRSYKPVEAAVKCGACLETQVNMLIVPSWEARLSVESVNMPINDRPTCNTATAPL